MPNKNAAELAGDSRLADSGNAGQQNRREATEGQTVGLAIESESEVLKAWNLVGGIKLGMSSEALITRRRCAKSPNDPKLSDSRSWRAGCMAGERWRLEAASVTAERVRCSAWLGASFIWEFGARHIERISACGSDWLRRWNYSAKAPESSLDCAGSSLVLRSELSNGRLGVEGVAKLLVFECCPRLALVGWRGAANTTRPLRSRLESERCRAKRPNNIRVLQHRI